MILAHLGELHHPAVLGLIPLAASIALGLALAIVQFFKRFK